jgi:hypothetical protein
MVQKIMRILLACSALSLVVFSNAYGLGGADGGAEPKEDPDPLTRQVLEENQMSPERDPSQPSHEQIKDSEIQENKLLQKCKKIKDPAKRQECLENMP